VSMIHHTAICVRDVDVSLRFWRDCLGFEILMDESFEGDWPTLLHALTESLRALFLGDPAYPDSGIVELVDLGDVPECPVSPNGPVSAGSLLLSVMIDLDAALERLAECGLGGQPRHIEVSGVAMAVVIDPDGAVVELVDSCAVTNLAKMRRPDEERSDHC
jgi:catechol 2,3-dioxygenase-like lactoylglutathione lyase family enzyme